MESAYRASSGTFTNYLDEEELPGPDREEFAAMLRVIADWLVPAEPKMPIYLGATGVDASIHAAQQVRQQLRQKLLDEAASAAAPPSDHLLYENNDTTN
jgi:hypothetical protein